MPTKEGPALLEADLWSVAWRPRWAGGWEVLEERGLLEKVGFTQCSGPLSRETCVRPWHRPPGKVGDSKASVIRGQAGRVLVACEH